MEELIRLKGDIETSYNNLSDPKWVAGQLENLKGKFDILTQLINNMEKEENATNKSEGESADSN